MRRTVRIFLLTLFVVSLLGCENVFHNDKLDYLWRLDEVEYLDGTDFSGNPCARESKKDLWFCFTRDLVMIENKSNDFSAIGVLTDQGETLVFDFSMYDEQDWPDIVTNLNTAGLDSKVPTFHVSELNRKTMVLTGVKTVLTFTRW